MKKIVYLLAILFSFAIQAQYNPDAPWMKSLDANYKKSGLKTKAITFQEIVDAFNAYWETRDSEIKGSGYKPFKRWETYWKNYVKEDGTLPSSAELWKVWEQVELSKQNSLLADLSNWQPVGPFNHTNTGSWSSGQGRINAIIVDPNISTTYYAGAPAGGIWKSEDSGATWVPLSDDLPQIGVSGIAIDYADSDIIYIATGDDDGADSYSIGVMKSTDGGDSWNTTGLSAFTSEQLLMNDIYIHPSNSNILWVATSRGIYKTTDAGVNWSNMNGTEGLNIKDIKLKPGNPDTIYAVTSNTLFVSIDAGNTFTNAGFGVGLPTSSGRLVIDVTANNPNVIYVLSSLVSGFEYNGVNLSHAFQGLYKSSDSGINFTTQAIYDYQGNGDPKDVGDIFESSQAWFDMAFAVSDLDENEVYTGVLNIWKSTNGGTDFTKVNNWYSPNSASYSHADIHLLRFYDGVLFTGTDGGFYKTIDGGTSFTDLTGGMQIGQFYRLTVSSESSQKMIGGLQDNGGYAYSNNSWQVYYGADGMDTAIDPLDSDLMFGFIQYGGGLYVSETGGASRDYSISAPDAETGTNDSGGNWITPLVMNRDGELYAGYSSLYKLCGSSWHQVSTSFGNNVNIDVLEIDTVNPNNIFVGLNKDLIKSTDKGVTFSTVESFSSNITSIEFNNNDSDIVYVTTSGSGGDVLKSLDGGLTFASIKGSLPNVTKNIIKHQNLHSENPLYLGTSLGVYRYDDALGDWESFENNLPTVPVRDLEINVNDANITAATYGRGIWQSNIQTESINKEIGIVTINDAKARVTCGNLNGVKALVKNFGTNNINSVQVSYSLNGGNTENTVWTGTILPNSTALVDIPEINVTTSGLQELKINTTTANDAFGGNNELITTFYANESGILNAENDFEDPSDELLVYDEVGNCSGYWERGEPTGTLLGSAASGSNVYGTNLSGEYGNGIKSYLVTKCYDLSVLNNPVFKFKMAFDLEFNWDIMYVEYSTDLGVNWNVLGTANDSNWYNSDTLPGSNCYNCPGAQWTGTSSSLLDYSYNLAALNTESNIVFRFVFNSDAFTTNEGVVIDDLSIEGTLNVSEFDSQVFSVYPNPSSKIFHLKSKTISEIDFTITDVTGKTVMEKRGISLTRDSYKLNMENHASGVYFISITSENNKVTKKLILK
ncbi:T9SS type A sorting domain-containing protein [Hyunsoonleella aestuarii]|uniref:T9SS type A sorting domain-containing protein n=1 Tax=Hyunsoonleella aestuarii TaxID=912802 RepID=A0ABP8EAC9_9FLAO|nr:T9SS type A sorting domain-containing protein [Hyunsoonleella aestuarii]